MTTTYTKSKSADFPNGLVPSTLHTTIDDNSIITKLLLGININGDVVDILFAAALSGAEETELDLLVTNYVYQEPSTVQTVKVQEHVEDCGERYRMTTVRFNTVANSDTVHDMTFNKNIQILNGWFGSTDSQANDCINIHVAPDTIIGTITAAVTTNDTVLTVSQTVIDNTFVGAFINLNDGTNTSNLTEIIARDVVAKTITVHTAIDQSFTVTTPTTYVRLTTVFAENVYIGVGGGLSIGRYKIGASFVPANTIVRFIYTETAGNTPVVNFQIEHLYS